MDRITLVPSWHHLVNDIDLCHSSKSPKKSIKTPILAFKVIESVANWEPVYDFPLVINSNLGPISHRYWDTATYWPKIANFAYPRLI